MLEGKYVRYIDSKGNMLSSRSEHSIAELLTFLNIDYKYNVRLSEDPSINIDFKTEHGYIEVIDSKDDLEKLKKIRDLNLNLRIIGIGKGIVTGSIDELNSIFAYKDDDYASLVFEDPSLSFDYAHILPLVNKCSVLHGHTASVVVELMGSKKDGMVIDFGEAKRLIKQALSMLDHKFFINKRYLIEEDDKHYRVAFDGPNGTFDLKVPKHTTFMVDGEATAENLAKIIIELIAERMPNNINAIGVYIYEGVSKSAHIVSRIR